MESEVFKIVVGQGVWACLFVYMLFYVLKQNGLRESKYQEIISKLTEKFECIEKGICEIQEDIKNIIK